MEKRLLLAILLLFILIPQINAQQPIRVKSTTESSNGKHRPVFYIVWPNDFKGNKYDVRVHISYDIKTSDGNWHNYNDATIYGVSGQYALEWYYAYTKPIVDMRIRIKSIDGYNQTNQISEPSTVSNKGNSQEGYTTPSSHGGGGDRSGGINLVLSGGYQISRVCYGPYTEAGLYFGAPYGGVIFFVGYGGRGHENIWRFGTLFYRTSSNDKNEFRVGFDIMWEYTKKHNDKDDMFFMLKLAYTHYMFRTNCLGWFVEGGIGMGGENINSYGYSEKDFFGASLQFGLRFNIQNLLN